MQQLVGNLSLIAQGLQKRLMKLLHRSLRVHIVDVLVLVIEPAVEQEVPEHLE